MGTSTNPLVLAVAAHDIGQYAKYYPAGKKYVSFSFLLLFFLWGRGLK